MSAQDTHRCESRTYPVVLTSTGLIYINHFKTNLGRIVVPACHALTVWYGEAPVDIPNTHASKLTLERMSLMRQETKMISLPVVSVSANESHHGLGCLGQHASSFAIVIRWPCMIRAHRACLSSEELFSLHPYQQLPRTYTQHATTSKCLHTYVTC